jgi:hypothetical protein
MAFPEKAPYGLIHKSVRLPTNESFFLFLVFLIKKNHGVEQCWGSGSGRIHFFSPDPDPDLVMYIYQIIVFKKMFLTIFFEKLS